MNFCFVFVTAATSIRNNPTHPLTHPLTYYSLITHPPSTVVMEELTQMLNFAPDSPLFVRQLSMYSADLERLGDFLQAMIKLMRQFQKDSASLARSVPHLPTLSLTHLITHSFSQSLT
jgi:hypothetical protein